MRVYVRLGIVGLMVAGLAAGAVAQVAPAPQAAREREMVRQRAELRGAVRERIRAQIEEQWGERIRTKLGLNDQQMERLRTATRANQDRQRDFDRRETDLLRGVMEQMRPGVAANQDSLGRMLDALAGVRVQRAQSEQQELRELAQFLNPVQRAQLLEMRRQLMNRIEQIRRGAPAGEGPMRRGMLPSRVPRDSQPIEDF